MESENTIQSLYDQSGLLDILLGVEEYFDNMDLYAYKNWIYGELVEGPIVSKYWVEVVFKYDFETFPDPVATKMFEKQGTKVFVKKDFENFPIAHPRSMKDMTIALGQNTAVPLPREDRKEIILYRFQIPRRLVNPESFDEYKLMASDFNQSDVNTEVDDPAAAEEEGMMQDQNMEGGDDLDLDFDEQLGGGL